MTACGCLVVNVLGFVIFIIFEGIAQLVAWNLSLLDGLWLPGRERAWLCLFHPLRVDRAVGGLELVASWRLVVAWS